MYKLSCSYCHKVKKDYWFYANTEIGYFIAACDDCRNVLKYMKIEKDYEMEDGKCQMCKRKTRVRTDARICEICFDLMRARDTWGDMKYVVQANYCYEDLEKYPSLPSYEFEKMMDKFKEWSEGRYE